jgi:hypothetical protein
MISNQAFADSTTAKQILAQNTTNPYCSAGSNEFNPFEASKLIDSNQYKSQCPSGMSYVQCLRETFKKTNQN